jgi:hypothetical protein
MMKEKVTMTGILNCFRALKKQTTPKLKNFGELRKCLFDCQAIRDLNKWALETRRSMKQIPNPNGQRNLLMKKRCSLRIQIHENMPSMIADLFAGVLRANHESNCMNQRVPAKEKKTRRKKNLMEKTLQRKSRQSWSSLNNSKCE